MKRKWHIKTRLMITLIGLTCGMLLVIALAFNLSIRSFIRSRVSSQLSKVQKSASDELKDRGPNKRDGKSFDDHADRITGTRGNAIIMDKDGNLLSVLHGENSTGAALAEYFSSRTITEDIQNEIISIESGTYAVSAVSDPKHDDQYLLVYVDITSLMSLTDQMNLMLFILILTAAVLSVFLSIRFSRSFSGPVKVLSDFAKEIGLGNLDAQELKFRDIEFDELAKSMNRMAADLRKAKQSQEVFFQNISHELRTPLTSIKGNAEGIIYGIMEPRSAAETIVSESDKLGGMVEDILYLSRMGKAVPDTMTEPLDLREMLSLCVSEQRAAAEKRGLRFLFDFDDSPVMFQIREQDAERLFGNLLSNAIFYAKNEITLSCHTYEEYAVITVSDDGSGISEEDLPHVFERFYKGNDGRHGIGLAIAEAAAQSYHGVLTVRNDNGAVFEVRFPYVLKPGS